MADLDGARATLVAELREHALIIGEVTLSSGRTAQYYVDARRTLMRPAGFRAAGELIAAAATGAGASAVAIGLSALSRSAFAPRLVLLVLWYFYFSTGG